MVINLETDQALIRTCIHLEVKAAKAKKAYDEKDYYDEEDNVEKAYRNFSKAFGKDFMEFTEYEYWYYRFYNGNHDLDYDRSLDPKNCSFSDLSTEILELLMSYLELNDRFHLRKVCRNLRDIFDSRSPDCKSIKVIGNITDMIALYFDDAMGYYEKTENGCEIQNVRRKKDKIKRIERRDPNEIPIDDIVFVMKHPKLKLESFKFYLDSLDSSIYLENCFKLFTHKIHVKTLNCNSESLMHILPYVVAGTLESIEIRKDAKKEDQEVMYKMFELNQWKQTKELKMSQPFFAEIKHFCHFTRLFLNLESSEDLMIIKEILLHFTKLEYSEIYFNIFDLDVTDIWNILDLPDTNNPNIRRYPIPNTTNFLEIKFSKYNYYADTRKEPAHICIGRN